MKLLKFLLIIFTIFNIVIGFSEARSNKKEKCNFKVYPGISNDGMGNILIAGKPSDPKNESQVYVSGVYKIPIFGLGGSQISRKLDINGEVLNGGSNSMSINLFFGYLPKSNIYYFRMNNAGQPLFSILKPSSSSSSSLKKVFNIHNTPFVPTVNGNTFIYGAYGIFRLNKLPEDVSDSQQSIQLYKDQIINGLSFDNENKTIIYMSTYQGTFLKGNINCINCTKDQLELIGNDENAKSTTDFLVYEDMMYFSYSSGIKGFSKSGGKTIQLISNENVISMVQVNGKIYFSTNDGTIKSIKLPSSSSSPSSTSNQPKIIFNPSNYHNCE
ncbi:hypothetical protein RB653_003115 [Dictyostelium firmibasis]|uniref:DUF5050 domain-containing protein n=1 Tax=Dictyostelium firmibasis TaxID=79012 RepID=A0AAN7TPZ7_9MYCE